MRLLLILVILVCFVLIGIKISCFYIKRSRYFNNLYSFCNTLKLQISYSQNKISDIIEEYKLKYNKEFNYYLSIYQKYLIDRKYKKDLINNKNFLFLSEDERILIANFFCQIGAMEKEEEIQNIEFSMKDFNEIKEKCNYEKQRYSLLYVKLFVVFGLIAVIIFI